MIVCWSDRFEACCSIVPVIGARKPPIRPVIRPPKNVSRSHVPNATRADVAARRISTDRSSPKASQRET